MTVTNNIFLHVSSNCLVFTFVKTFMEFWSSEQNYGIVYTKNKTHNITLTFAQNKELLREAVL